MKRPIALFAWILILFLTSLSGFSQTFQDFKKQIREEYDSFEKETQQKFNNFVEQIDTDFSTYLSDNFGTYDIGHEKLQPSSPKPSTIPSVEEVDISGIIIDYKINNSAVIYQGPVFPGIKKSEDAEFETQRININFLGWPLYFDIDKAFFSTDINKPSPNEISLLWLEMSDLNYNHFLYQVSEVANTLNINQWAYYLLLKECSKQVYPNNNNMQVLFQWAMLSRSRYKVKIGFNNETAYLLIPSVYRMYDIDFVSVGGINYYIIEGKGEEIQTYEKDFPESDILMDVSIKKPFYTNEIKKSRNYHFTYDGKKNTVNLGYDEEMINFYSTIPLSDISIYFNSVVSERTKTSVIKAFEPILKGKDDIESVNILLSFVQQAFGYKTDQYAYGVEKYFFADEVLHYSFSDCEDRSVLFTYLVRTLLNNEIIALGFPGHMATAINLDDDTEGDYLMFGNNKYIAADPTYMGAKVGVLVSAVDGLQGDVIPITNNANRASIAESIWKKVNESGGYKSDRLNDMVFDNKGNIYTCGYYINNVTFGNITLLGNGDNRDIFIAKYNSDLDPVWVANATGSGNDLAFSITLSDDGYVFIYGSLENELNFKGSEIIAQGAPDVFVAKYSQDGEFQWAQKAGIDKIDHSLDFMFAAKFNPNGKKIMAKLYSQTEEFDYYGLEIDNDGNALIKGSFYATAGMNTNEYVNYNDQGGDLSNIPQALYNEDKTLKEDAYEETIAGLFAALRILKKTTVEIQGSNIKDAFDNYNKHFKDYASGFYTNLSKMRFMKNEKGIITIKTKDGNAIVLDKIKINNDAHIRIITYKSKNILIEVLSGIYVGGGDYWLDMNSIKLYKESGDLLFDFDMDNSIKKLNLRTEILKRQ